MPQATVTSKGQITIPKEIRDALRLKPGDQVDFVLGADGIVRLRPVTRSIMELMGILKWDGPPVSVEQMNESIRQAVVERYKRSIR
jgi:antitoxin PrlF